MATKYNFSTLLGIKRLLPRRSWICDTVFQNLKTLGILKPLRAKKKPLHYNGYGNTIPVRTTDRLGDNGVKPRTILSNSGKVNSVNIDNLTLLNKMKQKQYGNLVPVQKVTEQPVINCGLTNCRSIKTKPAAICDMITEHNLSCLALTETWLRPSEEDNQAVLANVMPENYQILHVPRKTRGGGVGFIYKDCYSPKLDSSLKFKSFECQTVLIDVASFTYRFIIVYRVPPSVKNKIQKCTFINELGDLLELTATLPGKLVLLGDFNVHIDCSGDQESQQLTSLINSFNLVQHVSGATHVSGHTLDLVLSRAADDVVQGCEVSTFISDHNSILFSLKAGKSHPTRKITESRNVKSIDVNDFNNDILASDLTKPLPSRTDDVVSKYNTVLRELLDKHAPLKTRAIAQRQTQPWVNPEIIEAKRVRRQCERRWRKSSLCVHRIAFKESCEEVKNRIKEAKATYFIKQINDCDNDQRKLFQIVDKLLGRGKPSLLPEYSVASVLAKTFNEFFVTKISNIRSILTDMEPSTDDLQCPPLSSLLTPSSSKLHSFHAASISEIISIIKKSSKASCSLDPIPTSLLRNVLPSLAPAITEIVNSVLSSGEFPNDLKSAIVQPLLKKSSLDCEILKNFRPVSNLSFLSKVIEKVIASRLLDHMTENDLMDPMQSAYRKGHSTETALLRVHNDIVSAVDKGHGVCLILLDLSAAFDTVDHTILLTFLEQHIGLEGPPLNIFKSYLSHRTQCVSIKGVLSELNELMYGVPQGSVLGPLAFCIYTLPLGAILKYYEIDYHIYADDTQLYCSFDIHTINDVIGSVSTCISDIRSWMIRNKLKINDDKTEFLLITSPYSKLSEDIKISIGQSEISPSTSCKSLGVMLDNHMAMDVQIQSVCKSTLYHIRNISTIRQLIPQSAAAALMHSLVTSRLDYCNSLLYGVPACKLQQLQRVQNIAARVVTLTRCSPENHITPVLKSLHWLPIKIRIDFKILLLTYKCVNALAPKYLCNLVKKKKCPRPLRSEKLELLKVPKTRLKTYGDRSFQYAAAVEWNKLPLDIRESPSVSCFKSNLKTHLFRQYFK
jgi:hypothetical protein